MAFPAGKTEWPTTDPLSRKMLFPTSTASLPRKPHTASPHTFFSRLPAPSRALGTGLGVEGSICCPHPLSEARVHILLSHVFFLFTIESLDFISASPVFLLLCSQVADCDLGSELYCQQ